jgi:hypothetical protein
VFPHAQRTRGDPQPLRQLLRVYVEHVELLDKLPIFGRQRPERLPHDDASLFIDQIRKWLCCAGWLFRIVTDALERAVFAASLSQYLLADVARRLEDEARKRIRIAQAILAKRFRHTLQRLLRNVLCVRSAAEAAHAEDDETPVKSMP